MRSPWQAWMQRRKCLAVSAGPSKDRQAQAQTKTDARARLVRCIALGLVQCIALGLVQSSAVS